MYANWAISDVHERWLGQSGTNDRIRVTECERSQCHKGNDENVVRVSLFLNHIVGLLGVCCEQG